MLATCSFDRTACIWEEQGQVILKRFYVFVSEVLSIIYNLHSCAVRESAESVRKLQTHWVKRATLVDSRTSVNDIKFAPKHLGLQLVRIKHNRKYCTQFLTECLVTMVLFDCRLLAPLMVS